MYIKEENKPKNEKIIKSYLRSDKAIPIYSVKMLSGLNKFICFYLSFFSESTANEFVALIEKKMKYRNFKKDFLLGSTIGKGGFATIKKCTHIKTNKTYAVKIIKKFGTSTRTYTSVDEAEYYKFMLIEYDICELLVEINPKKKYVIPIKGVYETFDELYIVMEYVKNGNLETFISTKFENISIHTKFDIASQLVRGINFLHNNKIMHRDIKPANILMDEKNNIYLCDFGLASIIGDNECAKGCYGTVNFAPPEIFKNNVSTTSADIWSLGVVLYNLYYGELPFGENEYVMKDIINNILNQKVSFYEIETSDKEEQKLNEQFVNIIKMSLNKDAKKRPNVNEIEKLF